MTDWPTFAQTIGPALGGLTTVTYLLWRILNRDQSFHAIMEALRSENERLIVAISAERTAKEIALLSQARESKKKHAAANDFHAARHWRDIFVDAAHKCTCGVMEFVLGMYESVEQRDTAHLDSDDEVQ